MKKILITIVAAFMASTLPAQPTLVHEFGNTNDGTKPQCSVISDGTFLYGTAMEGGTNNFGIIYKVRPDGTGYSKLYDFDGGVNGSHPYGELLSIGTTLYGMTYDGSTGYGVLYKIKNDGTGMTKLLDFGGVNGQYPVGALFSDGTFLYGMTNSTIFKIKPDGTGYTTIHTFDGTHGTNPHGSLISDGTYLYGMTSSGGNSGSNHLGLIFRIMPDGTGFTVLYEFTGPNGDGPNGSLLLEGGKLYGYTNSGGVDNQGTIFEILPDGTGYVDLYDFHGSVGGGKPENGALVSDGTYLYGTTSGGGAHNIGTIYKIKHDGTSFTDIFDLDVTNGAFALASLFNDGTYLYGTTNSGGINSGGVVFKLGFTSAVSNVNIDQLINIYPDPSNGKFTIENTGHQNTDHRLVIFNAIGQQVYTDEHFNLQTKNIDLSNSPKGIYLLKIEGGSDNYIKKLIVQ
jgi:uncharacterized repeat protein (TIGR03803 family)